MRHRKLKNRISFKKKQKIKNLMHCILINRKIITTKKMAKIIFNSINNLIFSSPKGQMANFFDKMVRNKYINKYKISYISKKPLGVRKGDMAKIFLLELKN
ncbi:hypothetical protein [Candidatus Vidania fulgoroideorum]